MAGKPPKRREEWKTETCVRSDDPKSQSCGCAPGRLDYPTTRSTSRRRQHDSLAVPHGKDPTNTLENLCNRGSEDEGLRKEESFRSLRQDPYKLLGALRKKACSTRDDASYAAEDPWLKEESQDNCRGHRIGQKYVTVIAADHCLQGEFYKNARDHQTGENYASDPYDNQNSKSLGGHFFSKDERINPYREALSRSAMNGHRVSCRTPFNGMRTTFMDASGSPLSTSHNLRESRSSVHRSNADCPTHITHSRSGSLSSSRCVTPRRLRTDYSHSIPAPRDSTTYRPSRLDDPLPEEGFRSLSKGRKILFQDYPLSDSKPLRSYDRFVSNTIVAPPRRSSYGTKAPPTRRITLIERYQRGLGLRKAPSRNKGSSATRRPTNCPCSLAGRALSASGGKDPHCMCYEGYWQDKSEEGLSPLRSPWREFRKARHDVDPHKLQPCRTQFPANKLRRNNRQREIHYTDMRHKSAHRCGSPHPLNESSRCDDASQDNSYRQLDSSNSSQMTRGYVNYSSPQISRTPRLSTYRPQPWRSRPYYKSDDATREPSSYNYEPLQTKDLFTCTRSCSTPRGLSSANDNPHAGRNFSWEENPRPGQDSFRCARPHLARKDSPSSNDDSRNPRNFSLQNEYPEDLVGCTRTRLSAKDVSSSNCGPEIARKLGCQNEFQEPKDYSDQFDPHDARASWRQNDLYEARESLVDDPFNDPASTTNSCWYDDHGNEERVRRQDPWLCNLAPDTEVDESSSFKESQRESWCSNSGRETASKFDHQSDSWRQTDPHKARQGTSIFTESDSQRNSSRNYKSDEVRNWPPVKPKTNLRHDNTAPIKLPCWRSQEEELSRPVHSRYYSQAQSYEPFQTRESIGRVAARHSVSMQSETL